MTDVLPAPRAHAFAERVSPADEHVLGEDLIPPLARGAIDQRRQIATLHSGGRLNPGQREDGRRNVGAGNKLVQPLSAPVFWQPGIVNDQRHPGRQVIQQRLAAHAVVAQQQAVVAGEDDDRVVSQAALLQHLRNLSHRHVQPVHELVVTDVVLAAAGGFVVIAVVQRADSRVVDGRWQVAPRVFGVGGWELDLPVTVQRTVDGCPRCRRERPSRY